MAHIESLMKTEMITATGSEMVSDVSDRMSRNRVGAVIIVEKGSLRGLFSERDLLDRVIAAKRDPAKTPVGEVATKDVVTVDVDAQVKEVLAVFREKRFRHLPIVHQGKPVGILSTRDFLEYLVEGFERYIDDLKYKKTLEEGIDPYDSFGGSYAR